MWPPRDAVLFSLLLAIATLAGSGAVILLVSGADRNLFIALDGAMAAIPAAPLVNPSLLALGVSAVLLLSPALVAEPRLIGAAVFASPIALVLTHGPKLLLHQPRPLAVLDLHRVHVLGAALCGVNTFP